MATRRQNRREGRGQLSTIDMLPEEADEDIAWVNQELRETKRLQVDILEEFNSRLADRGIGPVSKSAFSRYSVRKAVLFREHKQWQETYGDVTEMQKSDSSDNATIAISEKGKLETYRRLQEGNLSAKELADLSRATKEFSMALTISTKHRQQIQKEEREKAAEQAGTTARKNGVSEDVIAVIERDILKMTQ